MAREVLRRVQQTQMKKHFLWMVAFTLVVAGVFLLWSESSPIHGARSPKTKQSYQLVIQKPRPHAPITLEETPEHLKPVVLQQMRWTRAYLTNLTAADVEIMKRWYQQQGTNFMGKISLTMTLGYAGDEEVVEMFKYALFEEFASLRLISGGSEKINDEFVILRSTVTALGLLASKYDCAYDLIKQGTNPAFWDKQIRWKTPANYSTIRLLVSFCISSIGGTGRPDSLDFINYLKGQDYINGDGLVSGVRPFGSAMLDVAFNQDMVAKRGVEFYKHVLLTEQGTQLEGEWIFKTENGRQWFAWANGQGAKRKK